MIEQNIGELPQLALAKDNYETINTAFEGDLWERKALGEHLTRYVDRLNVGAVLALDARWGEGKTWFARHWRKHLEQTEHQVIYLDAFANDYLEDPFLIISSEIANTLESNADPDLLKSFKQKAAKAYQVLLPNLPQLIIGLGLNLVGAGFLSSTVQKTYESGKELVDGMGESLSEQIKENIEKKIENYETEKQSLNSFKDSLRDLAASLDKPLVFIIDELDRCRPDFSIRMIERIKHFFDIPNIVFVLVMDKTQLTKVICHNYGYDNEISEEYLDKFIDFTIYLEKAKIEDKNYEESVSNILQALGLLNETDSKNNLYYDCIIYSIDKGLTLRQLKKILNQYALLKLDNYKKDLILLALLFYKDTFNIIDIMLKAYKNYIHARCPQNYENVRKFNIRSFSDERIDETTWVYEVISRRFSMREEVSTFDFINKLYKTKVAIRKGKSGDTYYERQLILEINEYSPKIVNSENEFYLAWENYLKTGL